MVHMVKFETVELRWLLRAMGLEGGGFDWGFAIVHVRWPRLLSSLFVFAPPRQLGPPPSDWQQRRRRRRPYRALGRPAGDSNLAHSNSLSSPLAGPEQ